MIYKSIILIIITLSLSVLAKEPVTHVVLCWMDTTLTAEAIDALIDETQKLDEIPGVEKLTVGKPIQSDRPIVDDSFSFGMTMEFKSVEKMNAYLSNKRHTSFVTEKIKPHLVKLVVYDIGGE